MSDALIQNTNKPIQVVCPICHKVKIISMSKTSINRSSNLTTVSIPSGLICDHHFQVFLDKNLSIRGYQKVDLIASDKKIKEDINQDKKNSKTNPDQELFDQLILDGNFMQWTPKLNKKEEARDQNLCNALTTLRSYQQEKKDSINSEQIFKTNHDKLIQQLLDGITKLNENFNQGKSPEEKEDIKFSLQLLEDFLENEAKCTEDINDDFFLGLKEFIEFIIST